MGQGTVTPGSVLADRGKAVERTPAARPSCPRLGAHLGGRNGSSAGCPENGQIHYTNWPVTP